MKLQGICGLIGGEAGDLRLRLRFCLLGKILRAFIFARHRSLRISEIRKNSVYAFNILVGWVDE